MIKKILAVLAVIIVVLVIVVALQPADFRIARSTAMAAPPAAVFAQVNDLRKFQDWSPWAKLDPAAKTDFQGPPAGQGASFSWAGNMEVGEGTMTITESRPGELVRFQLDFRKPMAGTNTAEFTFKPEGNKTAVTWSMSGHNNFMAKAVGLVMNCDKMVGGQFEKGLADLKTIVEAAPK